MKPDRTVALLLLIGSIAMAACGGRGTTTATPPPSLAPPESPMPSTPVGVTENPLDGSWTVTSVGDETVPADAGLTMVFAGEMVSGNAGCNQYSAPVTKVTDYGKIEFGDVASTLMMCDGPGSEYEPTFLEAMQKVEGYQGGDSPTHLALVDHGGTSLIGIDKA